MGVTVPFRPLVIDQSDVVYEYGPDSRRRPEVKAGRTVEVALEQCSTYPGTSRRIWIHIPDVVARCGEPVACMVFQDGWWYLDPELAVHAAEVLDNLTATGDIPPMVGVFVDPGVFADREDPVERKNRNREYDAFDSRYADFVESEVFPVVRRYVSLADDPRLRGICGGSSGGNAAFTAAWHRPDVFGRVVAFNSSFAQIPGGNPVPDLLASTPPAPLRIFLHAAHRDLQWNEPRMNWLAENLKVAAALAENGYDFRLVLGDGGHSPNHGGVLLPDALRWLWRD